jgi:enoyl-CoA hydratase/carnithine racemase
MIQTRDLGGGVWQIELCRPERRNALGVAAYAALADAFRDISVEVQARAMPIPTKSPRHSDLMAPRIPT